MPSVLTWLLLVDSLGQRAAQFAMAPTLLQGYETPPPPVAPPLSPLEALPAVMLSPKPPAKLEFTKDANGFIQQKAAYEERAQEWMQQLLSEFERTKQVAVEQRDGIIKDINDRIDLQMMNHEVVFEMEFERQDALLLQHFETQMHQLDDKIKKEFALRKDQPEEELKALVAKIERTQAEQLESIRAAAKIESDKFNQAKDMILAYHLNVVSDEVDVASSVQEHEDNYENVLRHQIAELESQRLQYFVN